MRDYETMKALIIGVAEEMDAVRSVVMNGSRVTNPYKDAYQDYDIVYFVRDYDAFIESRSWLDVFGQRLLMHTSDDMVFHPGAMEKGYMFQMLFKDGNRIDLLIRPVDVFKEHIETNRNYKVLLDKDDLSKELPTPSRAQFSIQKPRELLFTSCIKEILWVASYIAKGLCRNELLYALSHLSHIRENVLALMKWHVGVDFGFDIVLKKAADDLGLYLSDALVTKLYATYVDARQASIWHALFIMLELTEITASHVSKKLGYPDALKPIDDLRYYLKTLKQKC